MSTKRSAKLQLEDIEAIKMLKARYGTIVTIAITPTEFLRYLSKTAYGTQGNSGGMKDVKRSTLSSRISAATRSVLQCICS